MLSDANILLYSYIGQDNQMSNVIGPQHTALSQDYFVVVYACISIDTELFKNI
jgi:hypothetical protein